MAISGITTSYSNRSVDIEFLQSIEKLTDQQVLMSIQQKVPKIVSGVEKAAQRFTILLLSMNDSKFDTEIGSSLLPDIARGLVQNDAQLANTFVFAATRMIDLMNSENDDTTPDDEVVTSANLLDYGVDLSTGKVNLTVELKTLSGDDITFIMPTTAPRS